MTDEEKKDAEAEFVPEVYPDTEEEKSLPDELGEIEQQEDFPESDDSGTKRDEDSDS